jgi:hypothetical protein
MKVLKKTVSKPFASFYKGIVTHIGEPNFRISQIPGLGECHFEQGIPIISLRMDLNRSDFEHHAAHELIHALQYKEGWPRAVSRYPYNHPINELGMTLLAMVLDLDVEDRLKLCSFDSTYITNAQYRNLKNAILDEDIPSTGTYRWRKATIMYTYASLTQTAKRWCELKSLFHQRAPHIERKGEDLVAILNKNGWSEPDKALTPLIAVRQSIGLDSSKVGIIDGKTGHRF